MRFKLYSDHMDLPDIIISDILRCKDAFEIVSDPAKADFFTFPTYYQVAYDYKEADFKQHGLDIGIQNIIIEKFENIKTLSSQLVKQIIVFYISDSTLPLPLDSAIIFRSSLLASKRLKNEFAFPTNGLHADRIGNEFSDFLTWTYKPSVAFRGQAVGMDLPFIINSRNIINEYLYQFGYDLQFPMKFNHGYLVRRNAIARLSKCKLINFKYWITKSSDIFDAQSIHKYIGNLIDNQYHLVVSGHGNYSFRLYEVMAAGRIPVFVNTDCILPLDNLIPYKDLFVFCDKKRLNKLCSNLLSFHMNFDEDSFIAKQQEIKRVWLKYFSGFEFYKHTKIYLKDFLI